MYHPNPSFRLLKYFQGQCQEGFFYGHLMLCHNNEFKDILLSQRQHSVRLLTPVNVNWGSFICVADMGQGIVVKED